MRKIQQESFEHNKPINRDLILSKIVADIEVEEEIHTELEKWENLLESLKYTEDNWDGNNSPKPEIFTIEYALDLCFAYLSSSGIFPSRIGLCTEGGVQLVYDVGEDKYVKYDFLNSDKCFAYAKFNDEEVQKEICCIGCWMYAINISYEMEDILLGAKGHIASKE